MPGKNKKLFLGKPLVQWSIEQAYKSKLFDHIIVSSDDPDVLQIAHDCKKMKVIPVQRLPDRKEYIEKYGLKRWKETSEFLSGDKADIDNVIYDFFARPGNQCKYICLLPPTSPLRSPEDIRAMFKYIQMEKYWTVISVKWCDFIGWVGQASNQGSLPSYNVYARPNRQTRQDFYLENGSIYWFKHDLLMTYGHMICDPRKVKLYEMPLERSLEIDTPFDFYLCEKAYEYSSVENADK